MHAHSPCVRQLLAPVFLAALAGGASAQFRLKEVFINPPGADNGQEAVEISGPASSPLTGMWFVALEGDGTVAGTVDVRVDLSAMSTGSNGLLLIRDSAAVIAPAPDAATSVVVFDFNPDIENGSNTYILGSGTPPALGTDLDSNDDGVLNAGAFATFTVVDAVGVRENDVGVNTSYGASLGFADFGPFTGPSPAAHTPESLYRFSNADGSHCAWAGGRVLGTNPGGPYTFNVAANTVFGIVEQGLSALGLDPGNVNTVPDADGDGVANGCDGCPNDPAKTAPGICGCGVPDVDSDGDGTLDCFDLCPNDPTKVVPGPCGCGVPEVDSDGDGTPDCLDQCPNDPNKVAPGDCGCGVPDVDSDGDGAADCVDQCPNDPNKIAPGDCGCGVPDVDSDGDGVADCLDQCPNDPNKIAPGDCGCGTPDADSDRDGVPDCFDLCPNDPNKVAPGDCGCGMPDTDSDGDGVADCLDQCPNDPSKIAPGDCGCGTPDTDSDRDGVPDCVDQCPNDPNKVAPGDCGCGTPDADSDRDGTPDCFDLCPNDPNKVAPGDCGCGTPEGDTDGDGTPDCLDLCPSDPNKTAPGACGCGVAESACQTLSSSPPTLSVATGGMHTFTLNAGLFHAGDLYLVLGSASGTTPGIPIGTKTLPLNLDAYFTFLLSSPNQGFLVNTLGAIGPLGFATSALAIPPGLSPILIGTTLHHAYVVIDLSTILVEDISNTTSLTLAP